MGPANGARVLDHARALAGDRPLILTVTHFHPEHGFGAQVFEREALIVYNAAQRDELAQKGDAYVGMFRGFGESVAGQLTDVELVAPHVAYDGPSAEIDLGGRVVRLLTWGLAHTKGDQVVHLPKESIVFGGDLFETRMFPIVPYFPPDDVDVDGSAWIRVLADLEARGPRLVVPGHGAVGGPEVVAVQRAFMEELRAAAYAAADEGRSADEAVAEREQGFVGAHPDWVQPEWVGFGLRCFHAERLTR